LYDSGDQDVLVARVTTQEYRTEADYKIREWEKCGLLGESYVRLGKQATPEKRLIIRKLGAIELKEIDALRSILKRMFLL
jgi:mRNA interferase MazF